MQKPSKGICWRISDIYRLEAKTMNRRAGGDGLCKRELQWWSAAGTCRNPRGSTARGFAEAMESLSLTEGRVSRTFFEVNEGLVKVYVDTRDPQSLNSTPVKAALVTKFIVADGARSYFPIPGVFRNVLF